jgi:formylglycine-generating enzyme required for sulfatase activity
MIRPFAVLVLGCLSAQGQTITETFGTGANSFSMDFVAIGNPNNPSDLNGFGSVSAAYRIGKYEISREFIEKANTEAGLGLPVWNYSGWSASPSQPIYSTTFYNAVRFVNWLNVSKGYSPAYKFSTQPGDSGYDAYAAFTPWSAADAGFDSRNVFRNAGARFFIPTINEWYKAAYFDSSTSVYFDFATGSDAAPTPVVGGTSSGTAVYGFLSGGQMADVENAGGLSPYGTMGQTGNAWEWTEQTIPEVLPGSFQTGHGVNLGGSYAMPELKVSANFTNGTIRTYDGIGFRVLDSVPEPSSLSLLLAGGAVLMAGRRRKQD